MILVWYARCGIPLNFGGCIDLMASHVVVHHWPSEHNAFFCIGPIPQLRDLREHNIAPLLVITVLPSMLHQQNFHLWH